MELKVYDWEKFERWKTWYFVFAIVVLLVIVVSILSNNIFWWVLVLLIVSWYIYYLTKTNNTITMVVWKNSLQIDGKPYPWVNLQWFVLEYHTEKEKIHNIVIIWSNKESRIYTINDTEKNLENFLNDLNWYLPMLDNYDQSSFDKFLRKIKL